uniref:Putative trypsin-like serine protease n=1 Tax=Panstrongylus lignarius TaxID=156445 RepID=A0A224XU24_9HEMI
MMLIKFSHKIIIFLLKLNIVVIKGENAVQMTYAGKPIDIEEAPFTVAITVGCTGALIHRLWVITAAHCFEDRSYNEAAFVGFGTSNRRYYGYFIRITKVYIMPDFYVSYFSSNLAILSSYDIALIELAKPVILSQKIQILKLEGTKWPKGENRTCELAGFGNNLFDNSELHQSQMTVGRACGCMKTKKMLCAESLKIGDSPCYGDSGSVIVCNNKGVAVTSQAIPFSYCYDKKKAMKEIKKNACGQSTYYFLFTFIRPHLKWIKEITNYNKANKVTLSIVPYYYDIFTSFHISAPLIIFLTHLYR